MMLLLVRPGLGVISRVAPQLQLMSVGFPVTIFGLLLTPGLPMIERRR